MEQAEAVETFQSPIVEATNLQGVPDVKAGQEPERARDTYAADETAILDRCAAMLIKHGDRVRIVCGNELCPDRTVRIVNDPTVETGAVLQCGCTTRVLQRHAGRSDRQAAAAARRLRRGQKRLKR